VNRAPGSTICEPREPISLRGTKREDQAVSDEAVQIKIANEISKSSGFNYRPMGRALAAPAFADRAEQSIQLLSRWAGIAAFAGALAAVSYFLFRG